MKEKVVVTIAIEPRDTYTYEDAINVIHKEMQKANYCEPPLYIDKAEKCSIFEDLGFNRGTKIVLNLIFSNTAVPGKPSFYFPNTKICLEKIRSDVYQLVAISNQIYTFTEYI